MVRRLIDEREEVTAGGIVRPTAFQWSKPGVRFDATPKHWRAEVVAVGTGRRLKTGGRSPIPLEPGEHVLVNTWAQGDRSDKPADLDRLPEKERLLWTEALDDLPPLRHGLWAGVPVPGEKGCYFVRTSDLVCSLGRP